MQNNDSKKDANQERIEHLTDLIRKQGWEGKIPTTIVKAEELHSKLLNQRYEWIEERREEFKEQIESDLEDEEMDYRETRKEIGEYFDDYLLVGWKLNFDDVDCLHKKTSGHLLYLAQFQVDDIVKHLPPFDECPFECSDCELEKIYLNDIKGNKCSEFHVNYVKWDNPKRLKPLPKFIFDVDIGNSAPKNGNKTKKASIFWIFCVFCVKVILKVLKLFGKTLLFGAKIGKKGAKAAIEYEKEHKLLQRTTATAVDGIKKGTSVAVDSVKKGTSAFVKSLNLQHPRTWTDLEGKQVEATLIAIYEETVILQTKTGKQIEVRTDRLSKSDQEYIKSSTSRS